MSPQYTPIYRLPFLKAGEPITEVMERTRYMAIDRQLESLFTFLGNGVMSGWDLILHTQKPGYIIVRPGSGVVGSLAVASNTEYEFAVPRVGGADTLYYVYSSTTGSTPHTAAGDITVSTSRFDTNSYLVLGTALATATGIVIDMSEETGRVQLTFIRYLLESIAQHVHTGAPGQPDKIDLFRHVKGILSSANIEDLPASKITSGVFSKERFRLNHKDLADVGTLTHNELDTLIGKFQNINKLLFGDLMTANLIQLILSLKHVWGDVDEYFYNFAAVIPGIDNNKFLNPESFIDVNSTSAEIDFLNHRIRGKFVPSKEIGQYVINSVEEFSFDGNGNPSHDTRYVTITGVSDGYGYGYGYGYGAGDPFSPGYFDVILGTYSTDSRLSVGVTGTGLGTGLDEFESSFVGGWGYGYGYEEISGFTTTLESTQITLVSTSSSRELHNKGLSGGGQDFIDKYFMEWDGTYSAYDMTGLAIRPFELLVMASDSAGRNNWRSDNIGSRNFHTFSTYKKNIGGNSAQLDIDKSLVYLVWPESNPLDMTEDEYLHFIFSQVSYRRWSNNAIRTIDGFITSSGYGAGFDLFWAPDVTMNLIIEATYVIETETIRVYYKWGGDDEPFLDRRNNTYFDKNRFTPDNYRPEIDAPALMRLNFHITADNLTEYYGQYAVGGTPATSQSDVSGKTRNYPVDKNTFISHITGIYLYSSIEGDYGLEYNNNTAKPLTFPQGQREYSLPNEPNPAYYYGANLTHDKSPTDMIAAYPDGTNTYRDSTMLVEIDQIYISGLPGFRYSPSKNVVEGITVTFPDPVTFNSISWISSEPSDSIVYLLLKRNDAISGVDSSYNKNTVYTNKMFELNDASYYEKADELGGERGNWLSGIDPEDPDYYLRVLAKYKPSGSSFPSEYNAVKSFSIKAVLLPSTDLAVAPVLNSITINFTSDTHAGNLVISSKDDWSHFREQSSITTKTDESNDDYITIDVPTGTSRVIGKIKNLIYGSNRVVVEVGNTGGTWFESVKSFRGNGPSSSQILPYTVTQMIEKEPAGIAGYVTHIKKLKNGNILFLDQDGNRIVETDMNYNIKKIVASEYIYKNTDVSWMPDNITDDERYATILRAIYNPNLGDYGVIYFVFSHELKAWDNLYAANTVGAITDGSVDLSKFIVVVKAIDLTFADADVRCEAVVCDRGVLCVKLSEKMNNYIAGNLTSEIKCIFSSTLVNDEYILGTGSCVLFKGNNRGIQRSYYNIRVPIEKPDYNIIYAPITGTVAFDSDDDNKYYILKKTRPYPYSSNPTNASSSFDAAGHAPEPWYVKMDSNTLWQGWEETSGSKYGTDKNVFNVINIAGNASWEPNFLLDGVYGYRGCIEKKDSYLLVTISGEKTSDGKPNGVFLFTNIKNTSSYILGQSIYAGPEEFTSFFTSDGTYEVAARFDPATYNNYDKEYGDIYIALSDLKRNSSAETKSRIVKVQLNPRKTVWQWGTKDMQESGLSNSYALVINDIIPLLYNDTEMIVST